MFNVKVFLFYNCLQNKFFCLVFHTGVVFHNVQFVCDEFLQSRIKRSFYSSGFGAIGSVDKTLWCYTEGIVLLYAKKSRVQMQYGFKTKLTER